MQKLESWRKIFYVALAALIYVVVVGSSLINNGGFDDDRLYLYSINFVFCEPEAWDQTSKELNDFIGQGPYDHEDRTRFQFRFSYSNNYLIHAATICLARHLMAQGIATMDYGTWLYTVLETGIGIGHLICLLIVIVALSTARNSETQFAVLAALTAMAAFTLNAHGRPLRLLEAHSTTDFFQQALGFAIYPGQELDVFGLTPRNAATFLFVAIIAFRWERRFTAGYWVVVFAGFVHGTYGTLILVVLVSLDLILRPRVLRDVNIIIPILVSLAIAISRIGSFSSFDGTIIQTTLFGLGFAAFLFLVTPFGERQVERIQPVAWLRSKQANCAETLLVIAGMCLAILLAAILTVFSSKLATKYVAHEISWRSLALLSVPLILGLASIVTKIEFDRLRHFWPTLTIATALLIVVVTTFETFPIRKSWKNDYEMQSEMLQSMGRADKPIPEDHLYYALSCRIDRNCSIFRSLMSVSASR